MLNFPSVKTAIDQTHNIEPGQKVVLEWNYNTDAGIQELGIDDVPLYQYDEPTSELKLIETSSVYNKYYESIYPLTSVVSFVRPGEYAINNGGRVGGIVKAVFNTASSLTTYDHKASIRNYFVSKDTSYKYWAHLRKGQSSNNVNKSIYLKYDRQVVSNKIVVKFETAQSIPTAFTVYIQKNNAWVPIYTGASALTNGGLALYYNGSSWGTVKHQSPSISSNVETITGVKVLVTSLNMGYTPLEIIEVSARLEADVTSDVVSWSINKTMFEEHDVLPIGYISSNSAEVTFDNTFNDFSYEKTSAKYYGMLNKRVGVRIYSIVEDTEIPQFTGFIDSWNISANDSASIDCYDMAKVLQQLPATDMVIGDDLQISKVIRIIFDSVGLNEITLDYTSSDDTTVKIFWMSKEQTVWEAIQELLISHQGVLFTDEYGRFVFKSRSTALESQTTEQVLTYNQHGNILPNIVSISQETKPRIGNLVVKYTRRGYAQSSDMIETYNAASNKPGAQVASFRGGSFAHVIWSPSAAWTLAATPLVYPISATEETSIFVSPPEFAQVVQQNNEVAIQQKTGLAKFSGYLYINGEIIYYGATRFKVSYRDGRPTEYIDVSSQEEFQSIYNSDPLVGTIINTGELRKIKRAQFFTEKKAHNPVSPANGAWSKKQFVTGQQTAKSLATPQFSLNHRALKLSTDNDAGVTTLSNMKVADRRKNIQIGLTTLKRSNYKRFECNMRIVQQESSEKVGDKDSLGGIFFDYNTSTNAGYFIELGLESTSQTFKKGSNANKSLNIYKIAANGTVTTLAAIDNLTGRAKRDNMSQIYEDEFSFNSVQDYDVQVLRVTRGSKKCLDVYIMGQLIVQVEDESPLPNTTNAGVFVRGDSTAYFTKFAAWGANQESTIQDGSFFADSIRGFITEVVASGNLNVPSKISIESDYDYHEFYPYFREIRIEEFDYTTPPASPLKLGTGPAITLYGATILEANSFRAKIAVINETNASVDLASTFPGDPVAPYPKLLGYGLRKFEPKEYKTTISKAKADEAKFEIDSEWVQSYGQAKSIAEFIKANSVSVRNNKVNDIIKLNLEIFANPLIQLGDTVDIEYPDLGISSSTHSFVVTGITQEFNNGLSTSVYLQEVA